MALEEVGVKLVLDPGSFYADIGKANNAIGGIGGKAAESGGGFSALEQIATGALHRIGEAAINAGAMIAQGIVSGIGDSINVAADFEAQMSGIQAVLAPTGAEFDALRQKALDLGSSTAYSASEAAEGIEMLAKNGLDATAILGGAAEATLALAAATGADLAPAADIMTDAMAIFGITAENVGDAINGITGVTVASKFTIDDYRLALAQAGGVAGSVGVEFDDFNTVIAGISPLFASGSDAGTSFKTMLQRLAPTTGPAKEAMAELGLMTTSTGKLMNFLSEQGIKPLGDDLDTLGNQFTEWATAQGWTVKETAKVWESFGQSTFFDEQTGQLKDMDEVAGILQEALSGLSEEQKNVALSTIFGTDAMRAAVGLANLGTEGFNELAASIGGVDASLQAETRLNNFNGALEQMRGATETLQIIIGSALLPVLTQLLNDVITPGVNQVSMFVQALMGSQEAMTSLSPPLQQAVTVLQSLAQYASEAASVFGTDGLGASIATFGAGVAELNPMLGGLIQGMATVVDFLQNNWQTAVAVAGGVLAAALVPALVTGAAAFGAAVAAAAPVIGVLALVAGAAAALYGAWENNFGGIQEKTAAAMSAVQGVIQSVLTIITAFWDKHGAEIIATAQQAWTQIQQIVGTIVAIVAQIVTTVFSTVASFLEEHGATIQRILDVAWNAIRNTIEVVLNTIQGIVTTVLGLITGDWETASAGVQQIVDGLATFLTDTFNNILSLIQDLGPDFLNGALALGQSIIDGIIGGISAGAGAIAEAARSAGQAALDAAKGLLGISSPSTVFATEVGAPITEGIAVGILQNAGLAVEAALSTGNKILASMGLAIADGGVALTGAVDTVFSETIGRAKEKAPQLTDALTKGFQKGVGETKDTANQEGWNAGEQVVGGITEGIRKGSSEIEDAAWDVAQAALSAAKQALGIASPSREFASEVGYPISQGVAEGILDGIPEAVDAIETLTDELKEQATEAFESIGNSAADMFNEALSGRISLTRTRQNALRAIGKYEDELAELRAQRNESEEAEEAYQQAYKRLSDADKLRAQAQNEAAEIAKVDATAAKEYLALREDQILKILKLEEERDNATTKQQKARANRLLQLEREAQADELEQFRLAMQKRQEEIAAIGDGAEETGNAVVDGIIKGITDKADALADALGSVMAQALKRAQETMGIASPSAVFAAEVGLPIAEGVAVGIAQGAGAAVSAINDLSSSLIRPAAGARYGGGSSNSVVNQYYNYSPTYAGAPQNPSQDFRAMRVLATAG